MQYSSISNQQPLIFPLTSITLVNLVLVSKDNNIIMSEFPPASLRPLIQEVFELLRERKETVSVAETVLPLPLLCPAITSITN